MQRSQDKCFRCNDRFAIRELDGRCAHCFNEDQKKVGRDGPYQQGFPMEKSGFFSDNFGVIQKKFGVEGDNFGQ